MYRSSFEVEGTYFTACLAMSASWRRCQYRPPPSVALLKIE